MAHTTHRLAPAQGLGLENVLAAWLEFAQRRTAWLLDYQHAQLST